MRCRPVGLMALGALQLGCAGEPLSVPDPVDTVAMVLQVVEQANAALSQTAHGPLTEATAMRSLSVSGARMALVADSFPDVWGRTFVYDPGGTQYVPDDARPGAPASGFRFILYATNGGIVLPLSEVGLVDVVPMANDGYRVQVRAAGQVIGDFQVIGKTEDTFRCCSLANLTGPRQVSATGILQGVPFAYADTLTGSTHPEFGSVGDRRRWVSSTPTSGSVLLSSFSGSSMKFSDSDHGSTVRIAFPRTGAQGGGATGGTPDSTVVEVRLGGIRGSVEVKRIAIDGDATLLTEGTCLAQPPGGYRPCFRIRGDSVVSDTTDRFKRVVLKLGWSFMGSAYGGATPLRPPEALLAPVIVALRVTVP